jgi:hypothetical protein
MMGNIEELTELLQTLDMPEKPSMESIINFRSH